MPKTLIQNTKQHRNNLTTSNDRASLLPSCSAMTDFNEATKVDNHVMKIAKLKMRLHVLRSTINTDVYTAAETTCVNVPLQNKLHHMFSTTSRYSDDLISICLSSSDHLQSTRQVSFILHISENKMINDSPSYLSLLT